jgi:voltage-gated potassium channel
MSIYQSSIYWSKMVTALLFIIIVVCIGSIGYVLIEDWPLLDAVYMTIITLATVGFGEIHPLSPQGRIFTIGLILSGIGIIGYGMSVSAAFIVEGELGYLIKGRKMEKQIKKLSNHFIICGAGDTGRWVIEEFLKTRISFVVIEKDHEALEMMKSHGVVQYIEGDATKDAVLLEAGIERAKGLISTLHNDRDNVFVVLTARALNPNLKIVSRVVEEESEKKLLMAGADNVVSPNFIGGLRMASLLIRPAVVNFLDTMLREDHTTLRLEEVEVLPHSPLLGKTLSESEISQKTGLIVIAVKSKESMKYLYNPKPSMILHKGDLLIVMGDIEQVGKLKKLVGHAEP